MIPSNFLTLVSYIVVCLHFYKGLHNRHSCILRSEICANSALEMGFMCIISIKTFTALTYPSHLLSVWKSLLLSALLPRTPLVCSPIPYSASPWLCLSSRLFLKFTRFSLRLPFTLPICSSVPHFVCLTSPISHSACLFACPSLRLSLTSPVCSPGPFIYRMLSKV